MTNNIDVARFDIELWQLKALLAHNIHLLFWKWKIDYVKTEIISCLKLSFSIGTHCQYQGVKKWADKMKGKNQIPKSIP
jgi:hypothetical protein